MNEKWACHQHAREWAGTLLDLLSFSTFPGCTVKCAELVFLIMLQFHFCHLYNLAKGTKSSCDLLKWASGNMEREVIKQALE